MLRMLKSFSPAWPVTKTLAVVLSANSKEQFVFHFPDGVYVVVVVGDFLCGGSPLMNCCLQSNYSKCCMSYINSLCRYFNLIINQLH